MPSNGVLKGGTVVKIQGQGFFDSKDKQCKLILPNGEYIVRIIPEFTKLLIGLARPEVDEKGEAVLIHNPTGDLALRRRGAHTGAD